MIKIGHLERHDEGNNMHRYIDIHITPTLFGEYALQKTYGRIGQPGRTIETWYPDASSALKEGLAYRKKKRIKGYQ